MTLYEYLTLSNEAQWDELWDNGQFITHFKSIDCKFVLYAVHKFYIELELDVVKDTIIGKHEFIHGERMNKYVGKLGVEQQDD